jgi:methyltransferase (TIGR00027 family)
VDAADTRLVRNISDTALWVAYYRAVESERPDALFRDPFARRLAGDRGEQIARSQKFGDRNAWAFIARTVLFDRFITDNVAAGVGLVVNLAAGLDARPYRMTLPRTLRWIEVDLPDILDYKDEILASAAPVCALERIRLDLSDEVARRGLFARLAAESTRTLIVSEGLLIYLSREQVVSLARDLAAPPPFRTWIVDLASPGLMKMMSERGGQMIAEAGAPFRFAPPEGPSFFTPLGWQPTAVESLLKTARRSKRLPLFLRLIAAFPESPQRHPNRPWSAVVQLERVT